MKILFFSLFILYISVANAQVPPMELMVKAKCKDSLCVASAFKLHGYSAAKTQEDDLGKTFFFATDTVGGLKDYYTYEPRPQDGDNTFSFYTKDITKRDAIITSFTDMGFNEMVTRSKPDSKPYRNDKHPEYVLYSLINEKPTGNEYIIMLTYFLPED